MLTLIKHDLINTRKKFVIAFIVLLALSILFPLTGLGYGNYDASDSAEVGMLVLGLITTLSITTFFIIGISLLSIAIKQFQKSLFSNQGYLTFTLPFKMWQIVLSKIITFIIWSFSFILIYFISLNILVLEFNGILLAKGYETVSIASFYEGLWKIIESVAISRYFSIFLAWAPSNYEPNAFVITISVIRLILYIPLFICIILLCYSLSHSSLIKNSKSWVSAILFVIIAYLLIFCTNIILWLIARYIEATILPFVYDLLAVIAIIIGSFVISVNILENKLEF